MLSFPSPPGSPRVAVIMTCYNEGAYIGAAVRSVLEQSRADLIEAIVIADDGSDADTVAVLREIGRWDARIRILYGPGGVGLPGQRRKAIAETRAEILAILDGDDLWTPDKLARQMPVLAEQPEAGLVYADFFSFPDDDLGAARRAGVLDISAGDLLARSYFLRDPPIIPSTTLLRRSAYEAAGGFDAGVRIFEDTDFYLRLARVTRFAVVNEPLLYKRSRGSSITGGRRDLMAHHAFVALKAAAEDPALLPLVPRRLAERARKLANQRFLIGDAAGARGLSAFGLRLRPWDSGGWLAYLLPRLPGPLADVLRRTLFKGRIRAVSPASPTTKPDRTDATRVLYVINSFNRGGAEKGLLHLVRSGAFAGCSLRVVSIVAGQGAYVADLQAEGVSVEHLYPSPGMTIRQWLSSVPRLWRIMRDYQPALLVLSLPQANIAGRVASLFYRRRCVVASFEHNTHLAKPLYETLFRLTSRRVDWMLADCAATAREVGARLYHRSPKRTVILPLVSFPPGLVMAPLVRRGGRPFTIISAGRFTAVKNQSAMIEAIAHLRADGAAVRLILFGEGELLPACRKLAVSLGVASVIEFRGFVPDWAETPADAFLLSSQHEGLCIVAIEAMRCGLPVVAPRVGGLRDYGEAGRAHFLSDVSPMTIATAIARLIDDPALCAEMRLAGARMAADRFSATRIDRLCADFSRLVTAIRSGRRNHATDSGEGRIRKVAVE